MAANSRLSTISISIATEAEARPRRHASCIRCQQLERLSLPRRDLKRTAR